MVHPDEKYEKTFAIEIKDRPYFPVQDEQGNICLLHDEKGSPVQWTRYSAFGSKSIYGDIQGIVNPWRFANRREVASLSLFSHRFYNPRLMRWQTADPLGFEDGLNLYSYARNNPFSYCDPDGRFVMIIPLLQVAFGGAISASVLPSIGQVLLAAAFTYTSYKALTYAGEKINDQMHMENIKEAAERDADGGGYRKKQPPRTEPRDLEEELTLEEAKNNPGKEIPNDKLKIKDPRYPEIDWRKNEHTHRDSQGKVTTEIHYWENRHTGERHGFKFKDWDLL